ncbi:MAG TPA: hypothetical protein VMU14_21195 [Acidimicrobiales bacterium]|nr:hypothetical protein [Acidimicrobiales bacterium]
MTLAWDGHLLICDKPGCGSSERLPESVANEEPERRDRWLTGRAWATIAGRHYCPDHW